MQERHTCVTVILEGTLLNELVAEREGEGAVVHPGGVVRVNVDGRLAFATAHRIILGPICVWVCKEHV